MLRHLQVRHMIWYGLMLWLPVAITAQGRKSAERTSIFVVAVHDSYLFTVCPPEPPHECIGRNVFNCLMPLTGFYNAQLSSGGLLSLPPQELKQDARILDKSRANWAELARTTPGIGPSGWLDGDLKRNIEKEFRKHKNYTLTDSPDKADLIFLIEALNGYFNIVPWEMRNKDVRAVPKERYVRGDPTALIAVVVPSYAYMRDPGNSEAFLDDRLWTGTSIVQRPKDSPFALAPSPEILVRQFVQ